MAVAREIPMTQEEYDGWCWTVEARTEWANGKAIVMAAESLRDDDLRGFLLTILRIFVEQRGLGKVNGPNLQIRPPTGSRRDPDLLFVNSDRLSNLQPTYLSGGPTVAIEFVSDDSEDRDHVEKYQEYEAAGVQEYWIIDARLHVFEPFRLNTNGHFEPMQVNDGVFTSQAITGFWLRTEWLWNADRPPALEVLRLLGILPRKE
jgi:Uma2 family endonuclease